MALVSMRQLLDHAAEHAYGLPAFNVNNLEQIQAIMQAADEMRQPGDHARLAPARANTPASRSCVIWSLAAVESIRIFRS